MSTVIESCDVVVPVPMRIVESRGISDGAFRVYVAAVGLSMSGGGTLEDVADLLDVGMDTIRNRVSELADAGLLQVEDEKIYTVNFSGTVLVGSARAKAGERKRVKKVSLAAAQAIMANARATAESIHREQERKRAARKGASAVTRIHDHWVNECQRRWSDFEPRPWTVKDKALAKKLVADYGEDRVRKVISRAIDNWDVVAAKFNLVGVLNMSILWGFRDAIFPWMEMGNKALPKREEHDGEYTLESEDSDSGWGKI